MPTRSAVPIDPDAGIPDLIRRLVDDSRRLAGDEVRLAKIEMRQSAHEATRGGIWLGIAFGAGIVALIGLTVLFTALTLILASFTVSDIKVSLITKPSTEVTGMLV